MTEFDTKFRGLATRMLAKFGVDATYTPEPTVNQRTGGSTAGVPVPLRIAPPFGINERFIDGELIREGDMETIAAAEGITHRPSPGGKISWDGGEWAVVSVRPYVSGDQDAAYLIRIRK